MNIINKLGSLEKITLRFVVWALLFFGLTCIEGMMMRVNLCNVKLLEPIHYFAVLNAHPIVGIFGYAFMLVMGAFYFLVPTLTHKKLYAEKIAHTNLWLIVSGVVICWLSSFVFRYSALYTNYWPLPILRSTPIALIVYGTGLLLIMVSLILFCFNIFATILSHRSSDKPLLNYLISGIGLDGLLNLINKIRGKKDKYRPPELALPIVAIFRGSIDTLLDAFVLASISIILIVYGVSMFTGTGLSHKLIDPLLYKNVYWWGLDLIADGLVLIYVAGTWYLLAMVLTNKPIFAENVARAGLFIELFVSWMVWSHHLLSDQAQPLWLKFLSGEFITAFELVTTGIAIFCTLVTLWKARPLKMTIPLKFLLGAITGFSFGVIAGIVQADVGINRILHNTQWVVGPHAHIMILLGLSMTLFAGLYAIFPMVTKVELKFPYLSQLHFWFHFIGSFGMSVAMGYAGLAGMLRRTLYFGEATYLPYMYFALVFGILIVIGYLIMMLNIILSLGVKTLISLFIRIPALERS